jgi:ubiquinone/menaquinone biosynthesis C-methylase UbiE
LDHYQKIYKSNPVEYHKMISREDADSNLRPAIERVFEIAGKNILDLGSGTGRIPILMDSRAAKTVSIDISLAMLVEQQKNKSSCDGKWEILQGDIRRIPLKNKWADITICGWVICHFRNWFKATWKDEISKIISEMEAVTVAGGCLMIIETMSTGKLKPNPPTRELAEYYEWLEKDWMFHHTNIQTDYEFINTDDAVKNTEFFFGNELSDSIRKNQWSRVPEWTGIWYRKV